LKDWNKLPEISKLTTPVIISICIQVSVAATVFRPGSESTPVDSSRLEDTKSSWVDFTHLNYWLRWSQSILFQVDLKMTYCFYCCFQYWLLNHLNVKQQPICCICCMS